MPEESAQRAAPPEDLDRLIHHILSELGFNANPREVAHQVTRLDRGLSAEDEFSVICAWLGKCQLLHKLDQQQVPLSSRGEFQVPDLLAKFSTQTNDSPVLVEVKSKAANVLSFRPDYLERLKNYAQIMGMPLLIAWKRFGMWTLFDVGHLEKADRNFNIGFERANQQSLLGILAGDVAYSIGTGAGVHIRFRKDRLLNNVHVEGGPVEEWATTIDDVYFTDWAGNETRELDAKVQTLFMLFNMDEHVEKTDTHIHQHYIGNERYLQFAHQAMVRLFSLELADGERLHWRGLLRDEHVTSGGANFSEGLNSALKSKVVHHIIHPIPQHVPDYVSRTIPPKISEGA